MKHKLFAMALCAGTASMAQDVPGVYPITEDYYVFTSLPTPERRALLCPDVEVMRSARSAMFANDMDKLAGIVDGQSCIMAYSSSWGYAEAAHVNNFAKVRFRWLKGVDVDSGREVSFEDPEQRYWAMSMDLRAEDTTRIEPTLKKATGRE